MGRTTRARRWAWVWAACALTASASAQADDAVRLKVVSYNVWGLPHISPERAERIEAIGRSLAAMKPDLIAFQEVWDPRDAEVLTTNLRAAGLPHAVYFSREEQSCGLLVTSRFPIASQAFEPYRMGREMLVPWHLDYIAHKGVAIVRVTTPAGPVDFANTHLQARYPPFAYSLTRLSQGLQFAERVSAVGALGGSKQPLPPLIAAGDFNSEPNSLPVRAMRAKAALAQVGNHDGIDAILARSGDRLAVEQVGFHVDFDQPVTLRSGVVAPMSDHPGLVAEFELRPCAGGRCDVGGAAARTRWRDAAREVRAFLHEERESTSGAKWPLRVGAPLLPMLAFAYSWRRRRRALVWRSIAVVASLVLAVWIGYVGWYFAPRRLTAIAQHSAEPTLKP